MRFSLPVSVNCHNQKLIELVTRRSGLPDKLSGSEGVACICGVDHQVPGFSARPGFNWPFDARAGRSVQHADLFVSMQYLRMREHKILVPAQQLYVCDTQRFRGCGKSRMVTCIRRTK